MKKFGINLIILLSVFLSSCVTKSPEEAGKAEALKRCECETLNSSQEVKLYKKHYLLVKEGMENGTIKTQRQASDLKPKRNSEIDTCYEVLRRLEKQHQLDFLKNEDRKTLQNSAYEHLELCRKENKETDKKIFKETVDYTKKISALTSNLPWGY